MIRVAAPRWRRVFALAACCASRLAASAPTSAYGDAGSQGHSEAPFKLLSTTPGSGNGADDGKVTATPWDIVVLTLGCTVGFACCAMGIRRLILQSAKEKAAMDAALAAFGADRGDVAEDEMEAGGAPGGAEDDAARRSRRRERRAARQAQAVELPAGDRQLPQRLPSRGRRGASSSSAVSGRIPAWPEGDDAALAASLADDVELVPMYTFTPVSGADGDWFVAPLAHLPDEAPRRPRRRDREEQPSQPPEAQKSFLGIPLPPGWG
jgi:hypothetical protein